MTKKILSLAVALLLPLVVSAAPTQFMPDATKQMFMEGKFQVPAAVCTASGVPSPCCTGSGAGATCPVYKLALVTNSYTPTVTTAYQWSAANTQCSANLYPAPCCTGSGTGSCVASNTNEVGASGGYSTGGWTLASFALATATNHVCATFTTPLTAATATITARAAVIYDSTATGGNVIGVYCLDGSSCAADTVSTGGTFTVNLPAGGPFCIN